MKIRTGNDIHVEIADKSPDRSVMTELEFEQSKIDDEKRCQKIYIEYNDVIELLAYTRPRKVEAIRFSMVANASFDNLSERMKNEYRARASTFIPNKAVKEK